MEVKIMDLRDFRVTIRTTEEDETKYSDIIKKFTNKTGYDETFYGLPTDSSQYIVQNINPPPPPPPVLNNEIDKSKDYESIGEIIFNEESLQDVLKEIRKIDGLENAILKPIEEFSNSTEKKYQILVPEEDTENVDKKEIKDEIKKIKKIKEVKINKGTNILLILMIIIILIILIIFLLNKIR